jgi:hypothetical protein
MIASNEDFGRAINMLHSRLSEVEGTLNQLVEQNWESLKIAKRG